MMKKNYSIIIILSVIPLLIVFWYYAHKPQRIDDENIREMEYYLKQKECTQILIDRSNGHNVKLPEDCPQY
ncbi:hypothetical protein [Geminocystis herdmanii]|uniref:hypothetical protein n=1 Tax=Geminocystis herdmanii TaxID=669359 RepID=UPI00036CEC7D|nr:hypothetical protein [Geminocystis herdmanii]